jgi:hypothetical protein
MTNILNEFLTSPVRSVRPTNLILLDLLAPIIFADKYEAPHNIT